MARVVIKCPMTSKEVPTGISVANPEMFESMTLTTNSVSCPHCGQTHTWSKEDAFLR